MDRITKAMLEHQVITINQATGNPTEPYGRDPSGGLAANPGNYHLSWAYGGVCLDQICDDGHGSRSIISGYGTKRELHKKMQAFIAGAETKKRGD